MYIHIPCLRGQVSDNGVNYTRKTMFRSAHGVAGPDIAGDGGFREGRGGAKKKSFCVCVFLFLFFPFFADPPPLGEPQHGGMHLQIELHLQLHFTTCIRPSRVSNFILE